MSERRSRLLLMFQQTTNLEKYVFRWMFPLYISLCVLGCICCIIGFALIRYRTKGGRTIIDSLTMWLFVIEFVGAINLALCIALNKIRAFIVWDDIFILTSIMSNLCVLFIALWTLYILKYRRPYEITIWKAFIGIVTPAIIFVVWLDITVYEIYQNDSSFSDSALRRGKFLGTVYETVNGFRMGILILALLICVAIMLEIRSLTYNMGQKRQNYPIFYVARKLVYFPICSVLLSIPTWVYDFSYDGLQFSATAEGGNDFTSEDANRVYLLVFKWCVPPLLPIGFLITYCLVNKGSLGLIPRVLGICSDERTIPKSGSVSMPVSVVNAQRDDSITSSQRPSEALGRSMSQSLSWNMSFSSTRYSAYTAKAMQKYISESPYLSECWPTGPAGSIAAGSFADDPRTRNQSIDIVDHIPNLQSVRNTAENKSAAMQGFHMHAEPVPTMHVASTSVTFQTQSTPSPLQSAFNRTTSNTENYPLEDPATVEKLLSIEDELINQMTAGEVVQLLLRREALESELRKDESSLHKTPYSDL